MINDLPPAWLRLNRLAFTIPAGTHVCNMKNTDANNSIPYRNGAPAQNTDFNHLQTTDNTLVPV